MKSKKPGLFLWYVLFEPGMAQDSRPNIVDKFLSLILGPFFSPCRFSAHSSEFQTDIAYCLVYVSSSLDSLGGVFESKKNSF